MHIVEVIAVACHPHQQIPVSLRVVACRYQRGCIHNIELDMMSSLGEVAPDKITQLGHALITPQQAGQETEIQERSSRLHLIEPREGADHGRGAMCVASVRGGCAVGDGFPCQASVG